MPNHRVQHNIESVKREIIAIIKELKDPRLSDGFISVLKVSSADNYSGFRIFITALEGIEKAKVAVKCLESATGFIKKELGSRLRIKFVPELKFIATDAVEYGINISKKIDDVMKKDSKIEE